MPGALPGPGQSGRRLRTRTYPDGGVEAWGYTANVGPATHHTNQLGKVTLYAHDALGRKTNEVQVGLWTNSFTYTPAGDLWKLTDGKNQTTTWVYDAEGRVKEKWYQGQSTADLVYWYDADGRLTNRLTRTGTGASTNGYSTVFHYDATGSLTNVDYPVGTADLKYAYDALGRLTNMVDASGTTTYTYAVGGGKEIISEDGPWSGDVLTVTNRQGRRLGLQLTQPAGNPWWQTNAYDAAGRLATLASPAGAFGYSYKSAAGVSPATLIGGISLPTTGGTAYITNFYDTTGRLTSTQLRSNDHSIINLHGYAYNAAHQRILGTRTNVSVGATYSQRTGYSYDDAGQLTVAWVTNSAGSLVSGESRGYAYDPAQNLARRTNNAGGSTVTATVNALNQLTAGLGFSSLTHDRRGNLTFADQGSGAYSFAYDHENQCISAGRYYGPYKSDFVYDGKGRLRRRTDYSWSGSSWTYTSETRYVYDGMLLIQERTSAGHPAVTYTRGSDLSGSLAGAGGIGGLLARTAHQSTSPYQPSTSAFYHADGNGNVTYLLNQARTHGASYRYDPYGRLIASSGTLSSANLMRFSSKPWHDHSETYYYGYRFYLPEGQRWINRDPIGERGGFNLYEFSLNEPVNLVDPWGLRVSYDENGDIELDGSTTAGESVRRDRRTQDVHDALNEQALKDAGKALEVACIFLPWDKPFRFLRGLKAAKTAPTRWSPLNGPGPVGADVAATFRGGSYTELVTSEATTLYRAYGGEAGQLGRYWTRTPPAGPLQSRIDSALNPAWGNTANSVSTIQVPAGTRIFDGFAAPQGGLLGGGSQVYIPRVDPRWIVNP